MTTMPRAAANTDEWKTSSGSSVPSAVSSAGLMALASDTPITAVVCRQQFGGDGRAAVAAHLSVERVADTEAEAGQQHREQVGAVRVGQHGAYVRHGREAERHREPEQRDKRAKEPQVFPVPAEGITMLRAGRGPRSRVLTSRCVQSQV